MGNPVTPVISATLQDISTSLVIGANATSYGTPMEVAGLSKISIQVSGNVSSATVQPQGTIDGVNWVNLAATNLANTVSYNQILNDGVYRIDVEGLDQVRAPITTPQSHQQTQMTITALGVPHA